MKNKVLMKGSPKPVSLDQQQKEALSNEIQLFIANSPKLSKRINRFDIKANHVYFYYLVEQFRWDDPEAKFIKPLIDGKYAEFKYARITIYQLECTIDWLRSNDQWLSLFTGTFTECLKNMDENNEWFE